MSEWRIGPAYRCRLIFEVSREGKNKGSKTLKKSLLELLVEMPIQPVLDMKITSNGIDFFVESIGYSLDSGALTLAVGGMLFNEDEEQEAMKWVNDLKSDGWRLVREWGKCDE